MRSRLVLLIVSLLALPALAGCLGGDDAPDDGTGPGTAPTPGEATTPQERESFAFNVSGAWSEPLHLGEFDILDAQSVFVEVPLPETEGGNAINPLDPPQAHLGLFLPDIPGCDWAASDLPEECQVPVIADAGPYYATPGEENPTEGDVPADERGSRRLGEFLISNYVPHGYAVAQVSVMGSGQSNHCFDMFGLAEQLGVHHAVEWLGDQPWSNGNVGLIGRSYDGSTPWMAAAHGSDHLKTIVPISGLSGLLDLVQWNGASESRILTFHNAIYGTFGIDDSEVVQDGLAHATCPDYLTAAPSGAAAYAKGDNVVDAAPQYWAERDSFVPETLENYQGSLYMIHGLQDNNVDPHAGWRAQVALDEAGFDVKSLWGQWYHSYPDRPGEHGEENDEPRTSVRYDWAQDLLEWFEFYLKETGEAPALHHEIQQSDGAWRVEPEFPPSDAVVVDVSLGDGTAQVSPADDATTLDLGVLDEDRDVLMGGLSSVTIRVTPTGPGGQVYVELRDGTNGTDFGLSYGIMDLRHRSGEFEPAVAGTSYEIEIPLQNFDAVLPAGHSLELVIDGSGNNFLPSTTSNPVEVDLAGSTLHLSTLERGPEAYFEPPAWIEAYDARQAEEDEE